MAKKLPQPGEPTPVIKLRCQVTAVTDGDTVTAQITIPARVRLLNCWAPESRGAKKSNAGKLAKQAMEQLVADHPSGSGVLTIPLDGVTRLDELFTMGRVLGFIQLDGQSADLSTLQVESGHATREKPPESRSP